MFKVLALVFATIAAAAAAPERFADVEKSAARGDAGAQVRLGWMYESGSGVARDYAAAASWYRRAAEEGNGEGENSLGWLYQNGQGVPQDYGQAASWYRKAALQGNSQGEADLGWLYETGNGVAQDFAEAARWYEKAAIQGNADAQNSLGWLYEHGSGVAKDLAKAAELYRMAAAQGNAQAQANEANLRLVAQAETAAAKDAPAQVRLPTALRARYVETGTPAAAAPEARPLVYPPSVAAGPGHWTVFLALAGALLIGAAAFALRFAREGKAAKIGLTPAKPFTWSAPETAKAPKTPAPITTPPFLAGNYEVGRVIGEGGMGVVLEAFDRKLSRKVAIKKMRAELRSNAELHERFVREARIISHLTHPYIVGIHDIVEDKTGTYLVFDFVDGKPLSTVLSERNRLSLDECRKIMGHVCEAVHCAHSARVLHRDLKPANIMLDVNGYAKVMDFGIARQAKESLSQLTNVDTSGTPAYMAPEHHLGRAVKASDVFALGVCLYEMLTGARPFLGPDFLAQKERRKFVPPQFLAPELPQSIEPFMSAALDPEPKTRIPDAMTLLEGLRKL